MDSLRVGLFGQFQLRCRGEKMTDPLSPRLQELLCYLLLFRDRAHPREVLASQLWPESTTCHSRRNLRQALWQLQSPAAMGGVLRKCKVLLVDRERIQVNPEANLWLDVQLFEDTLSQTEGVPGQVLDRLQADALRGAVALYRGDLLQGWYQEWCLYERERLQNAYLHSLDRLMDYCEARGDFDSGLAHGNRALQCDGARERTHRRLMRLHCLVGERPAALRQYARCVEVLRRELGVKPAARTLELYQQIRVGHFPRTGAIRPGPADLPGMIEHFQELQVALNQLQDQVQDALEAAQQMTGTQG